MPGFLSTYDRFVEKYIRYPSSATRQKSGKSAQQGFSFYLAPHEKRCACQICRLFPKSSIIAIFLIFNENSIIPMPHLHAKSLSQLVKKEGFDKVQIHVLATLTRLKQICCHPAIFAKDKAESGRFCQI